MNDRRMVIIKPFFIRRIDVKGQAYLAEKADYKEVQKLINELIQHQPDGKQKSPKSN
jgi:hypothetical protein